MKQVTHINRIEWKWPGSSLTESTGLSLCNQTENAGYELERLHSEVTSLCSRIELLPCSTARDRLAQSGRTEWGLRRPLCGSPMSECAGLPNQSLLAEMAKRVANILRAVLSLQQSDEGAASIPLTQLAPHITRLPMPEDYALDELRGLTQSYLRQLIVSSWAPDTRWGGQTDTKVLLLLGHKCSYGVLVSGFMCVLQRTILKHSEVYSCSGQVCGSDAFYDQWTLFFLMNIVGHLRLNSNCLVRTLINRDRRLETAKWYISSLF